MMTLAQAKTFCAPWVDRSGIDPDDPRVTARINEAQELLGPKGKYGDLMRCLRFCVHGGFLTLGRDIKSVEKYRIDGEVEHVWSKWYEFLEGGPGPLDSRAGWHKDFIDRGKVCTQYDPHEALSLMVVSDEDEDEDAVLTVRGYDDADQEVRWNGQFGEAIPIRKTNPLYSVSKFRNISNVVKPVTNGYVHLAAVTTEGAFYRYHLASYHPDETNPSYRRYAIYQPSTATAGYLVTALCKLQFVPASHDTDVLYIQNLAALKRMIQAIGYYDAGELQKGQQYEVSAEAILAEADNDETPGNNEIDFQMTGFMEGTPQLL